MPSERSSPGFLGPLQHACAMPSRVLRGGMFCGCGLQGVPSDYQTWLSEMDVQRPHVQAGSRVAVS
eukprot:2657560-Pyramimonas_sp.AAC.1